MVSKRAPAKGGSKEHHRRISEGLKEYHEGKSKKKKGWLAKRLANHFHPNNVAHRKIGKDPEVKRARKEARKAEGELYNAVHSKTKLSPEKIAAIKEACARANKRRDEATSKAVKKYGAYQ